MKPKLQTFTEFTGSLFPHEIEFLISSQQFEKEENRRIFGSIAYNSTHPWKPKSFDESIDKRTYSYLKSWMEHRLEEHDIDRYYVWLNSIDLQIMNDRIPPEQENYLIKKVRQYKKIDYHFIRFYEILQNYRYYLLIRLRHKNYNIINDFLEKYRDHYRRLKDINQRIHEATIDIINTYTLKIEATEDWESWLKQIFYDESVDGYNRYLAVIRLTFKYTDSGEHYKLKELYDNLDRYFMQGEFYSKRILANYYSNRALLHARLNEGELAKEYGYLSIRQITDDYIQYANVLCSILLRGNKPKEALKLMQSAMPEVRKSKSYHNRIGFVVYYIRSLNANNQTDKAASYAETFLEVNKKEIMEHRRWHFFFVYYLYTLCILEKYTRIIQLTKRFELITKEQGYRNRNNSSLPSVYWIFNLALYQEGRINHQVFEERLIASALDIIQTDAVERMERDLICLLEPFMPEVMKKVRSMIA